MVKKHTTALALKALHMSLIIFLCLFYSSSVADVLWCLPELQIVLGSLHNAGHSLHVQRLVLPAHCRRNAGCLNMTKKIREVRIF